MLMASYGKAFMLAAFTVAHLWIIPIALMLLICVLVLAAPLVRD